MSENTQIDEKFEISYLIHIERKEFPLDIIKLLEKHNIKFGVWKLHNLKAEYDDIPEENKEATISLSIPKELYNKIAELCKINNLDTNEKINRILGDAVFSAEVDKKDGSKHVFNF